MVIGGKRRITVGAQGIVEHDVGCLDCQYTAYYQHHRRDTNEDGEQEEKEGFAFFDANETEASRNDDESVNDPDENKNESSLSVDFSDPHPAGDHIGVD